MLGWSEAEVTRMSVWEMVHPDDLDRTRSIFDLTLSGQPALQFPNRFRCKDGSYRWISWAGVRKGIRSTAPAVTSPRSGSATPTFRPARRNGISFGSSAPIC
ncbi:PAS domain-containing protein [Falsirhodobacter sp. 1013]|uniref:PAS domain-containing protein n=1 Tax=Falsirhodobacter sp. 1013 TaxID=3417566 RepID=UPI003EC007FD